MVAIKVLRKLQGSPNAVPTEDALLRSTESVSNAKLRKFAMRRETEVVGALRRVLLDNATMTSKDDERFHKSLLATLNRMVGVKDKRMCSLEQLKIRDAYLQQLIRSKTYVF